MNGQPRAIWLATVLEDKSTVSSVNEEAAAELRRQHGAIKRLREEIERLQNTKHHEAPFGFVLNPDYLVPELKAENERLREALQAALDGGCSYVHENEDDEIGRHGCCDALSYKPHEPDCWTLKAKAALRREEGT